MDLGVHGSSRNTAQHNPFAIRAILAYSTGSSGLFMRSTSLIGLCAVLLASACSPAPLKGLDTGDSDVGQVTDGGGSPGGSDDDSLDTSVDTAPALDTDAGGGDTDPTDTAGGNFVPIAAQMYLEFGVNPNGAISDYRMQGTRFTPRLMVTMIDALGSTCDLEYDLNVTAFNTWLANGTAPPAAFKSWLGTQAMYVGMALDAGLYTAVTPLCTFDPARWTADPHAAFLLGEWDFGIDNGMPAAVQTIIDANGGLAAFYPAGWDPANALGGYFQVPVGYFGAGGQRNMEAYGLATQADVNMNVTVIGTQLVPVAAATIYDDTTGAYQPVFVRLFSMYQINF